jgi:DNA-directed RNA polymerase specialized sigma24 family protein
VGVALTEAEARRFIAGPYASIVNVVTLATGSRPAAEDAVQQALARAWERGGIDDLDKWVLAVALNLSRSRWRKLGREVPLTECSGLPSSLRLSRYESESGGTRTFGRRGWDSGGAAGTRSAAIEPTVTHTASSKASIRANAQAPRSRAPHAAGHQPDRGGTVRLKRQGGGRQWPTPFMWSFAFERGHVPR